MKISAAKPSQRYDSEIILFSDVQSLEKYEFNSSEKAFIEDRLSKGGNHLLRINRHPQYLHLVYIETQNDPSQLAETLRLQGVKLLRMIKAEGMSAAQISSLDTRLSPLPFAEGMALGAYQFLKYYSDKDKRAIKLKKLAIVGAKSAEVRALNALISGTYLARDLVNEPNSFLSATQLAREVSKAANQYGFKADILNKKKIQSLKMGGLLAVNKGSQEPPTFSILEHHPEDAINKNPIILVGKGVVYDTGGLSLKPTAGSMDSMKSDMAGAAAVIGTFAALAQTKLPLYVIGLIPATDNRPGEKAYAPGDVIKMFDGSTVEVLNTDAEGRMLLADALAYAKKYKPELVVDLATLTGAAAIAIGKYGVVAMGTAEDDVFDRLRRAGNESYERIAQFPFWDEYHELLKSNIADQKNIGGREAGAITAGKFLQKFTDYPWVHLDIAGPAFLDSDYGYRTTGGTGVGVRLLMAYFNELLR